MRFLVLRDTAKIENKIIMEIKCRFFINLKSMSTTY